VNIAGAADLAAPALIEIEMEQMIEEGLP